MHHPVRADVERFVEKVPHHRHEPLGHFQNVAIGRCHGDVDARREQHSAPPGVRRESHTMRGGQRRDPPDLRHAARPCYVRLRDIQRAPFQQILEVEPRELPLARGDGDGRCSAHFRLTGVVVGRDRLFEPGNVVLLQFPSQLDGG